MKSLFAFFTLLLAGGMVTAFAQETGAKFQPFNVKPGLWQKTSTFKMSGAPPIPAGMLDKLTPEQRARFEERMKASSSGNTRTENDKDCFTKEQLQKPMNFSDKQCKWTVLESTSTKAKGRVSCEAEGMQLNGSGEFEAPDQEHIRGSEHVTSSGGGNEMTVDGTFSFKWLSASCKQ